MVMVMDIGIQAANLKYQITNKDITIKCVKAAI